MTIPFPAQTVEGPMNQLNWESLGLSWPLLVQAPGRSSALRIVYGTTAGTFSGSATFVDVTITHSLGSNALAVVAIPVQVFEVACVCEWRQGSSGSVNTELVRVWTRDGSTPANTVSKTVSWVAVG